MIPFAPLGQFRSSSTSSAVKIFLHPPHRLFRQLVERGHAEFEVLFLRVLDFVVADAMQALDEHHHRRHARGCDFGGVVQRAARQAMPLAARLADGFVA